MEEEKTQYLVRYVRKNYRDRIEKRSGEIEENC